MPSEGSRMLCRASERIEVAVWGRLSAALAPTWHKGRGHNCDLVLCVVSIEEKCCLRSKDLEVQDFCMCKKRMATSQPARGHRSPLHDSICLGVFCACTNTCTPPAVHMGVLRAVGFGCELKTMTCLGLPCINHISE